MATIFDIKKDREPPKVGEEVTIGLDYLANAGADDLIITKNGEMRCWLRLRLDSHEKLRLIRELLTK